MLATDPVTESTLRLRAKRLPAYNAIIDFVRENPGAPMWALAWNVRSHFSGSVMTAYKTIMEGIRRGTTYPSLELEKLGANFQITCVRLKQTPRT